MTDLPKLVKRGLHLWTTEDRRFSVVQDTWRGYRTYDVFDRHTSAGAGKGSLRVGSTFTLFNVKNMISHYLSKGA